ncbi:fungal-specific transcription factor domain-containing protein [Chytriomyces cf. hyalinus JEL632]|nr:fungal-specific transcription factor domain-containing protein [Chytriomyces cf. hyalinus JEL632]
MDASHTDTSALNQHPRGPDDEDRGLNKRARIVRACDPCRKKRARCSGELPCANCAGKPSLCIYVPPVSKKKEPDADEPSKLDRIDVRLERIEQRLASLISVLEHLSPPHLKQSLTASNLSASSTPPHHHFTARSMSQSEVFDFNPQANPSSDSQAVDHRPSQNGSSVLPFTYKPLSPQQVQLKRLSQNAPTNPLIKDLKSVALPPPPLPKPAVHERVDLEKDSSYKTGGFLINTEETALTFWGSTSALGGRTHNAHLYKAIPRFINGILMVHIPARTLADEAKEASETPRSENSPSVHSSDFMKEKDPYQEKGLYEAKEQTSASILSLVTETVEMRELIPLPEDLVDHILKNFWEQFHPQFPLIDQTWFNLQLARLRRQTLISVEEHWRFILLLTSVVALMLNFTPSLTHWRVSKSAEIKPEDAMSSTDDSTYSECPFADHDVALRHLIDSYKRILFDHFEIADVIMVQSLLFMVLTGGCARGSRFTGAWQYMGICVRLSQELGLHRSVSQLGVKHKTFDKETIALRNRTWHCVMIMETYTCIWTGRPLAIHDNDWDAEYPLATCPEIATLKHHFDLAQIIASILRFANRARPADAAAFEKDVSSRLDLWWSKLDSDWRNVRFAERWNSKALMLLMYHSAVILFHRTAHNHTYSQECVNAARGITYLVSRFEAPLQPNECVALFPTFTYCAMMACTVHIGGLLSASAKGDAQTFVESVRQLEKCMCVFDNLRGVFLAAERCWKTVLDFLMTRGIKLNDLLTAVKSNGGGAVESIMNGVGRSASMRFSEKGTLNGGGEAGARPVVNFSGGSAPGNVGNGNGTIAPSLPVPAGASVGTMMGMNSGLASALFGGTGSVSAAQFSTPISLTSPQKLQLQQLGALSIPPGTGVNSFGMDPNFGLWDGLSLFDLAGLGGISSHPDLSMLSGVPNHHQSHETFNQVPIAPVTPQHTSSNILAAYSTAPQFPLPHRQHNLSQSMTYNGSALDQLAEVSVGSVAGMQAGVDSYARLQGPVYSGQPLHRHAASDMYARNGSINNAK